MKEKGDLKAAHPEEGHNRKQVTQDVKRACESAGHLLSKANPEERNCYTRLTLTNILIKQIFSDIKPRHNYQ